MKISQKSFFLVREAHILTRLDVVVLYIILKGFFESNFKGVFEISKG
jgi:hypothetical protein